MSAKRYDKPPTSLRTLEQRLRSIIGSDGREPELFSRLRQEIANVIIGQSSPSSPRARAARSS
jgi:hypothetical protein